MAQIRGGISRIGAPFEFILEYLELPPEIAWVDGRVCLAEETISGRQLTSARGARVIAITMLDKAGLVRAGEAHDVINCALPVDIPIVYAN